MKLKELDSNCIIWCKSAVVGMVKDLVKKYGSCQVWKVGFNRYDYEISYDDLFDEEKKEVDLQIKEIEEEKKEFSEVK